MPNAIGKLASLLPAPQGKAASASNNNRKAKKGNKESKKTNAPKPPSAAACATKESQLAICSALGLQANGAVESLPSLAWVAGNSEEQEVKLAAAGAITRIDPDGDWLVYSIDDEDQRNRIMCSLHEAGERSLLDTLKDAWVVTVSRGPRLGFKRMLKKEIGSYVYGIDVPAKTPSGEKIASQPTERKKRADRISKRIDDWIETRRLRAIRVARGIYDVNVNDLEVLRTIYLGQEGDAADLAANDASSSEQWDRFRNTSGTAPEFQPNSSGSLASLPMNCHGGAPSWVWSASRPPDRRRLAGRWELAPACRRQTGNSSGDASA